MKQRNRMEKKRPAALRALTLRMAAAALALWLAAMACMTLACGQIYFQLLLETSLSFARNTAQASRLDQVDEAGGEAARQFSLCDAVAYASSQSFFPAALPDGFRLLESQSVPRQTAVAVYSGDGTLLKTSGSAIYGTYVTQAQWDAGQEEGEAFVSVDVEALPPEERALCEEMNSFTCEVMRITGVLEGTEMVPSKIEYIGLTEYMSAQLMLPPYAIDEATGASRYSIREVLEQGDVPWHTLFDQGGAQEDAVTLYLTGPHFSRYENQAPVSWQGERYENLRALLLAQGPFPSEDWEQIPNIQRLDRILLIEFHFLYSPEDSAFQQPEYRLATAIEVSPLKAALRFLLPLYPLTLAVAALGVLLVRRAVKRRLLLPLHKVCSGMEQDWVRIPPQEDDAKKWQDAWQLYGLYETHREKIRAGQDELTRLSAALDYAKAAEQNRRQMTSAIAHELKTPLAVIHSYAEGLQEHIAEEKREKYLEVILSETERMDGMVLEMLDLSRLEAGRVKLARSEFSLARMTEEVFEKLALSAREKGLKIQYRFTGECQVNADEGRIRQVVENFASNAVKYTPPGGAIQVEIIQLSTRRGNGVTFTIENEGPPLSQEALEKVWDTFYREDSARSSGGGTGLGLAIAKSIIELHGGRCSAANTKTGVAFRFTL